MRARRVSILEIGSKDADGTNPERGFIDFASRIFFSCCLTVSPLVGQDGILRPIVYRPSCNDVHLREGRLTIGRRIPSRPTRLNWPGMSSILLDRLSAAVWRFSSRLPICSHPSSSAFSNGSIEVVSQFLQHWKKLRIASLAPLSTQPLRRNCGFHGRHLR